MCTSALRSWRFTMCIFWLKVRGTVRYFPFFFAVVYDLASRPEQTSHFCTVSSYDFYGTTQGHRSSSKPVQRSKSTKHVLQEDRETARCHTRVPLNENSTTSAPITTNCQVSHRQLTPFALCDWRNLIISRRYSRARYHLLQRNALTCLFPNLQ